MNRHSRRFVRSAAIIASISLTACGGGGGSGPQPPPPPPPPPPTFTVGGTVSGLTGTGLALALNGAGNLAVNANGAFTFANSVATGATYTVTVVTQPNNPRQNCSVSGGTGTIAAANITSVSVACKVAGRFAYVANNGLNNIESVSAYSINSATGLLTALAGSPFQAGHTPISLAVRPDGKFLYVVNPVGMPIEGALSVFSINDASGVLTPIANSPFVTSTALFQIAIEPTGKFAFTPNFTAPSVSVFSLDATTGVPTPVNGSPFGCVGTPISVAVDPNSKFVYVSTSGGGPNNIGVICAYTLNASTGALTPILGSPFPGTTISLDALTVDPSGQFLFAAEFSGLSVFRINASGALTAVGGNPVPAGSNPTTVAVDPAGKFVYVGNDTIGASEIFVFAIDATTGSVAQVGNPVPSGDTPAFITIDPSGDLAYVANIRTSTITVYAVNKTTGALTATGSPIPNGTDTNPRSIAILK